MNQEEDKDEDLDFTTGGKFKKYINSKNEAAEDAMSNIATAHVGCKQSTCSQTIQGMFLGSGRHSMDCWLLQNQPNDTNRPKVLHTSHAGTASHTYHCARHPE